MFLGYENTLRVSLDYYFFRKIFGIRVTDYFK